jgi:hypothetical protein
MDQIHVEMLKAEETVTHQVLTNILQNIWTTEHQSPGKLAA